MFVRQPHWFGLKSVDKVIIISNSVTWHKLIIKTHYLNWYGNKVLISASDIERFCAALFCKGALGTVTKIFPCLEIRLPSSSKSCSMLILLDQETPQIIHLCTCTAQELKFKLAMLCNAEMTSGTCMETGYATWVNFLHPASTWPFGQCWIQKLFQQFPIWIYETFGKMSQS